MENYLYKISAKITHKGFKRQETMTQSGFAFNVAAKTEKEAKEKYVKNVPFVQGLEEDELELYSECLGLIIV